jgi:hypothetical protein
MHFIIVPLPLGHKGTVRKAATKNTEDMGFAIATNTKHSPRAARIDLGFEMVLTATEDKERVRLEWGLISLTHRCSFWLTGLRDALQVR